MKKIILFILFLFLLASFAYAEGNQDIIWQLGTYVDEFDDPTGECFIIGGPYNGKFSNSATTDSELLAYIIVEQENCRIRLLEYNTLKLFSISDYNYNIAVKATIRDEDQETLSPYMDQSKSIVFYMTGTLLDSGDILIENKIYDENYHYGLAGKELNGIMFSGLSDILMHSSVVKLSITKVGAADRYLFTADNLYQYDVCDVLLDVAKEKGYAEAKKLFNKEKLYQEAVRASKNHDQSKAIAIFNELENYKDSADRLLGLTTSSENLSTDNITVGSIIWHTEFGKGTVKSIDDTFKDDWGLVYDIVFDNGAEEKIILDVAIEKGLILTIENP